MAGTKKVNDFKDKSKIGIITAVHPQQKTVDITYISQAGNYINIQLPYNIVGLTWGFVFMPVIGDKVIIDNSDGDRPIITSMYPNNVDYLPYLDPGEIAMVGENGSYIFARSKRKRAISDGTLLAYNATVGPNGSNDIEYEPGGLILRARSKQSQDSPMPRWDNHSYLALFDNGDVSLQSMYKGLTKSLLFMDGNSGFTHWNAGTNKVQEFIEMNPLTKEMVFFTDGDIHTHVQNDSKETIYGNIIKQMGGGIQVNLGLNISTIPADFTQITANSIVNSGDIVIDNSQSLAGKATLTLKGDFDILTYNGNININTVSSDPSSSVITITSGSDINLNANRNVFINAQSELTIQSQGNINLDALSGNITFNNGTDTVATIEDINNAITTHTHADPQGGSTGGGLGGPFSNPRKVFTS